MARDRRERSIAIDAWRDCVLTELCQKIYILELNYQGITVSIMELAVRGYPSHIRLG